MKLETLTMRIDKKTKNLLQYIAKKENRSLTNMIETLIINHAKKLEENK